MTYQPYEYAPRPSRSAIPKVVGILMIIMCSLSLVVALIGMAIPEDKQFAHMVEYQTLDKISKTIGLLNLPITLLGFVTGILAVSYKRIAPTLALVYGLLALLHTLVNAFVVYKYSRAFLDAVVADMGGQMDSTVSAAFGIGTIFGAIIGIAWALVVLLLMTRPNAKLACQN
jgi:hypothetical protein